MSVIGHNSPPPEDAGPYAYAIYRIAKIKTAANLAGSANHMTRAADTPNADPGRAHLNRVIIGSDDPAADVRALLPEVGQRDRLTGKMLRRTNSVLAVEVLLTTSPEWWDEATTTDRAEWERRSTDWLRDHYGAANLVHLRMHADEQTPHLTGYVVPLDPETGALNCRRWTGERQQLRDQQTEYADRMAPLGLQRGIPGSTATHEAVRRAYGALSAPETPVAVPVPPFVSLSPQEWAREATAQMTRDLEPTVARAKTADLAQTRAKAATAQAAKDRGRVERAQVTIDAAKAVAARMRALDLPDVLDRLGFEQDPSDALKWKAEGFAISVGTGPKAGKWFDQIAGTGRGGAIDLVQHTMGTDFKGALAWLADRFGEGATTADVTAQRHREAKVEVRQAVETRPAFAPPAPVPEHWSHVRRWLTGERALPATYIDKLHDKGDLYADSRRNAVFLCRDKTGTPVGAELKGTVPGPDGSRFTGLAPGSVKDRGGFRVGPMAKAAVIYLVESAIDAISLAKLRAMAGEKGFAVVSTAGTTPEPRTWFADMAETVRRVCAYDRDEAGDKAALGLRRHRFERLHPTLKDWNDDLRALRAEGGSGTVGDPFAGIAPSVSAPDFDA